MLHQTLLRQCWTLWAQIVPQLLLLLLLLMMMMVAEQLDTAY